MKDKIIQLLKTKYSNLGFSDKAFSGVAEFLATTTTDEEIDNAVSGVEFLLKAFQGDADSRVNSALKTLKAEVKGGDEQPKDKINVSTDDSILNAIKSLTEKVQSLETQKIKDSLSTKWLKATSEKGVTNEKLVKKWQPETIEDFDGALNDLLEVNQAISMKDTNENVLGKPVGGAGHVAFEANKGKSILEAWDASRSAKRA